ncbi:MAG: FAD-dependent oxidoreductase, partial [Acidobacteriota bacterium]
MGQEQETIVVVGAGIAGLGTTMALHKRGQHVVLLDRDPPPPSEGPAAAFENWDRRGVAHLRQSHVFIGLLYGLIREEHPRLLEMLLEAGCRELRFEDGLPVELRPSYRKRPGDEEMTFLSSRRTTLELVMRRYVESLDGVEIRTGRRVREVLVDRSGAIPVLQGVKVTDVEGAEQTILGDVVVDACGRSTRFPQWLSEHGVVCQNDEEDAEIQYFTRHYRLLEGQEEPPRGRTPPNGDLTFLKFGVFPGDNGCFSITLALPTREAELRRAVKHGESFDRICSMLPGLAPWTDPQRAAPTS